MIKRFFSCIMFLSLISLVFSTSLYSKETTGSSQNLTKGWFIQSSEKAGDKGDVISSSGYSTKSWIPATIPSTVMGTLVKNKIYKNLYVGKNLLTVPKEQFEKSWWFRTEFKIASPNTTTTLQFNGIIYRANIWFNGKLIADSGTVFGSYRQFEFNVSNLVSAKGKNTLAVEIFPAKPGEPNVGFVDWNPKAPDNNMGLWREVKVKTSGDVSLRFPFVKSKVELEGYKTADLIITAELKNNTDKKVEGELSGKIEAIKFSKKVTLEPNESKLVTLDANEFSQLRINNPRLWWTFDYGKPELYNLSLQFKESNKISDESFTTFGIREISDYFNEEGGRGYKLNGKKILIRGGGWADDLFLNQSLPNLKTQIEYAKHINLNTIRLEGIWGNDETLFNLCDQNGIFLMVGWSCQWEWDKLLGKKCDNFGGISTPDEMKLISQSWKDQIKWLRNHPSIFVWMYGSDLIPRPELEKMYQATLKEDDPSRPYLQSASVKTSSVTGKTGVKMNGPYDYVPPIYWFTDTVNGGAFGFNTETSPGPQVPPMESIRKMFPKDHLWPIDSVWFYHCGGNVFNSLARYNEAMDNRLGKPAGLQEYLDKAQYLNYEGMRAMYEAFGANKYKATGIIQWMYNSAWPKLWWQLYDYYLMPNGAFYGAKKASEPLHIQYNPGKNEVEIVNNTLNAEKNVASMVSIYDFSMKRVFSTQIICNSDANSAKSILKIPELKLTDKVYFIDLKLYYFNTKKLIGSNFYALPTVNDSLDLAKTTWYTTPLKQFADLKDLNKLEKVKVNTKFYLKEEKDKVIFAVDLKNPTDKLAFNIELLITKGPKGESVLPVFLEDNYISLLPNEEKIINGYVYKSDLGGKAPALKINGWNLK
jgi:exo-1,4-beta-D-glucosaminidase